MGVKHDKYYALMEVNGETATKDYHWYGVKMLGHEVKASATRNFLSSNNISQRKHKRHNGWETMDKIRGLEKGTWNKWKTHGMREGGCEAKNVRQGTRKRSKRQGTPFREEKQGTCQETREERQIKETKDKGWEKWDKRQETIYKGSETAGWVKRDKIQRIWHKDGWQRTGDKVWEISEERQGWWETRDERCMAWVVSRMAKDAR